MVDPRGKLYNKKYIETYFLSTCIYEYIENKRYIVHINKTWHYFVFYKYLRKLTLIIFPTMHSNTLQGEMNHRKSRIKCKYIVALHEWHTLFCVISYSNKTAKHRR